MLISYLYLAIAILLEVTGTLLLPVSQNFSKPIPTIILAICYIGSFYLLTHALATIPLSIAYASWSGLGVFTIAIAGYFFFGQSLNWQAIIGLFLIVAGVTLVNAFGISHSQS